jgi:hypothetical protein
MPLAQHRILMRISADLDQSLYEQVTNFFTAVKNYQGDEVQPMFAQLGV